jgi:iron complex transport system ATP-binding protein
VIAALEATGMLDLADRLVDQLSGGQQQRAWIAMALAQETQILLLDEPTTFLDIAHQIEVLNLLTELNRNTGSTIVLVLHDLNLACRYAHHLVTMAQGRIIAEGPPTDVVTPPLVKQVFDLNCCIIADPITGTPLVILTGIQTRPSQHHPSDTWKLDK